MPTTNDDPRFGVIDPASLYTITAFKRLLGIRDSTLRAARRAGLQVHYKHKQAYILGAEWISYVISSDASSVDRPTPAVSIIKALDQTA